MESKPEEFDSSRGMRSIPGGKSELTDLLRDVRDALTLKDGGGGGTSSDMERLAKLEARADMTDQRLGRIEDKLDRVLERMGGLPTTNGLWGMVATVIGVGLAISGLTFMIAEWVKP